MATTQLLFTVLRWMAGAAVRSAVVAALFALDPLQVESVAWVSERKDTRSTLFWPLCLWACASDVKEAQSQIFSRLRKSGGTPGASAGEVCGFIAQTFAPQPGAPPLWSRRKLCCAFALKSD
jgi:hypothetical protein